VRKQAVLWWKLDQYFGKVDLVDCAAVHIKVDHFTTTLFKEGSVWKF
jgi:hypothetical protein